MFIGITGNKKLSIIGEDERQISYTSNDIVHIIQNRDASPIIIPIGSPTNAREYINRVDGLLVTGGQDVTARLYGEKEEQLDSDSCYQRDLFEIALIREAYRQSKPILAICRGMQIVNVAFGGTLYQELDAPDATVRHRQKFDLTQVSHSVTINPTSELFQILNQTSQLQVNSYHHQAVKDLATPFKASAWASDGTIEAFEAIESHITIIGIQWHPEFLLQTEPLMNNIFTDFIENVQKYKLYLEESEVV